MSRARAAIGVTWLSVIACGRHGAPPSGDTSVATPAVTAPADTTPAADTAAVQQPADSAGVEVYTEAVLSRIAGELAKAGSSGRTFGGRSNFHYVESRRVASGTPEVHDDWTDVTLVQAGRATLLTGGRVVGGALESPGEHRGGSIAGGAPRPIAVGDLVVVPAGIPHQFQLARGDSIRYLTIKVRR